MMVEAFSRKNPNHLSISAMVVMLLFAFSSSRAQQSFGGTRIEMMVNGSAGFVVRPPHPAVGGAKPWVWYAPTINGYPNATLNWYFDSLVVKGFWIAGIDVGESYGNPAGRKTFSAFYDTVRARYGLDPKACLFAQSRGGLMLYNWAADSGNTAKIARILGVYTVCDMRSYPGLANAAPAYGMTEAQLSAILSQNNPIDRLAPLAAAKIKILHIHGDNDNVVPLSANSKVLYDRYTALNGPMQLIVVPGQGHAEIPEFFQVKAVLDFLLAELTPTARVAYPLATPEHRHEPGSRLFYDASGHRIKIVAAKNSSSNKHPTVIVERN